MNKILNLLRISNMEFPMVGGIFGNLILLVVNVTKFIKNPGIGVGISIIISIIGIGSIMYVDLRCHQKWKRQIQVSPGLTKYLRYVLYTVYENKNEDIDFLMVHLEVTLTRPLLDSFPRRYHSELRNLIHYINESKSNRAEFPRDICLRILEFEKKVGLPPLETLIDVEDNELS